MAAANTDYFTEVGNPGTATTLAAPGHSIAGTTFNVVSTSNWPTNTGVVFAVDTFTTQIVNGVSTSVRVPGSYTEWEGVVTSSTVISTATLRYGTDQNYPAGSTTRVYIPVAASRENRLAQGIQLFANQDGSLKTAAVQAALGLTTLNGYTPVGQVPSSVTYNGNRSYTCVFSGVDLTSFLSAGMRIRTTRTVLAPTQCTSLNGTTQYWSKSSPAGMTFTDDFVVSAWVKLASYPASGGTIISRYNGTSGWRWYITVSGQIELDGFNAGSGNARYISSNQSVPLNRWVHLAAQLDMSANTATTTTSYVMIDGVDVPAVASAAGTSPVALIQAGNLEVGSSNGGLLPFPGKIAQATVTSAKVLQATIQSNYYAQTVSPTETSVISTFPFNGNANDANTTNANNLTANGSSVATNADSPFGGQADGTISSTLDYAIIQKVTFSTNTTVVVQAAEGCTIPTSGGVSAVVYSSNKTPYAFPTQRGKWTVSYLNRTQLSQSGITTNIYYNIGNAQVNAPIGEWQATFSHSILQSNSTGGVASAITALSSSASALSDPAFTAFVNSLTVSQIGATLTKTRSLSVTVQAPYYQISTATQGAGTISLFAINDQGAHTIDLENAYL